MTEPFNTEPDERDVADATLIATLEPTDQFRATLRDTLHAESMGDHVVALRPIGRPHRPRPAWTVLIGSAAVLVLVVSIALTRRSSDDGPAPADPPVGLDESTLSGRRLAAQLTGRTWLAVERLDVPVTPTRVDEVAFTGPDDDLIVTVRGCEASTAGRLDGRSLVLDGVEDEGVGCVDGLRLVSGQTLEMLPDGSSFILRDEDGQQLARLVDLSTLDHTAFDELSEVTWYTADLVPTDFIWPDIVQVGLCTRLRTDGDGADLRIESRAELQGACSSEAPSRWEAAEALVRDIAAPGASVTRVDDGIVLRSAVGAVLLRSAPSIDVDPSTATVGAGALFGVETGFGVTVDQVRVAAAPAVGEPTFDSGWTLASAAGGDDRFFACQAGDAEYREIHWNDVVATFWRVGSRTTFASWYVGEAWHAVAVPQIDRPDVTEPSGLESSDGIRVGDPIDDVPRRFGYDWDNVGETRDEGSIGVFSRNPAYEPGGIVEQNRSGVYRYRDGLITGFDSGPPDFEC